MFFPLWAGEATGRTLLKKHGRLRGATFALSYLISAGSCPASMSIDKFPRQRGLACGISQLEALSSAFQNNSELFAQSLLHLQSVAAFGGNWQYVLCFPNTSGVEVIDWTHPGRQCEQQGRANLWHARRCRCERNESYQERASLLRKCEKSTNVPNLSKVCNLQRQPASLQQTKDIQGLRWQLAPRQSHDVARLERATYFTQDTPRAPFFAWPPSTTPKIRLS